jgi:hypothetical protein
MNTRTTIAAISLTLLWLATGLAGFLTAPTQLAAQTTATCSLRTRGCPDKPHRRRPKHGDAPPSPTELGFIRVRQSIVRPKSDISDFGWGEGVKRRAGRDERFGSPCLHFRVPLKYLRSGAAWPLRTGIR